MNSGKNNIFPILLVLSVWLCSYCLNVQKLIARIDRWIWGAGFFQRDRFMSEKKRETSFCPRSNCLSPFMGEFWSEE